MSGTTTQSHLPADSVFSLLSVVMRTSIRAYFTAFPPRCVCLFLLWNSSFVHDEVFVLDTSAMLLARSKGRSWREGGALSLLEVGVILWRSETPRSKIFSPVME